MIIIILMITYKKLHPDAKKPTKAPKDAGYDLYSIEDVEIAPFERRLVRTGLAIQIPEGKWGEIKPRSGSSLKSGIDVMAGVIDCTYRGEVGVLLINFEVLGFLNILFSKVQTAFPSLFGVPGKYSIKKGDKIAQMVIQPCVEEDFLEGELSDSDRGEKGFGSTGR